MAITAETRTDIIEVVVGVIGAAPGADILSELADIVDGGLSLRDLTIALVENPVFKQVYPSFLTNEEFATQYLTAILDGEVSAEIFDASVDAVTSLLNAGESRGAVVYEIIQFLSGVPVDDEDFGGAAANLANKTEVAEAYSVDTLQSGTTLEELQGVVAEVDSSEASKEAALAVVNGTQNEGTEFTLTSGADEFTGTVKNDTFVSGYNISSTKNTLTALDQLDGVGGDDTLKIFDEEANVNIATTTQVMNIETALVNVAKKFTGDLTDWSGLTTVNLQTVGGDLDITLDGETLLGDNLDGNLAIVGAGTINLTDVDANSNAAIETDGETTSISITGGHAIVIDDDGAAALSTELASVSLEDQSGSANIFSAALTDLSLDDVDTNVNIFNDATLVDELNLSIDDFDGNLIDANGNYATLNLDISKKSVLDGSSFGVFAQGLTDLVVTGSASATMGNIDLSALETITLSESAGLTLDATAGAGDGALVSIDGTASDGDNDYTLTGGAVLESVALGAGDDSVDITTNLTAAVDTQILLGAGDDTFVLNAGLAHDANSVIDGEDGNDTLAILDGKDANSAAEAAIFSNFETLEVGGGTDQYELDLLGLTDITISAALAGDVVLNDAAAAAEISTSVSADLDWTSNVAFVLADDTGTSDNLTINLDADDGDDDGVAEGNVTTQGIAANGIETVTINATVSDIDANKASTPATDESLDADDYGHTVTALGGDEIETLIITGNATADITIIADDANALTDFDDAAVLELIDASGNTGGVTIDVSGKSGSGVTFNGTSAVDNYTASGNGDTIQANGGVNTTTGTGDLITLGTGDDTVRYVAASDSLGFLVDITDDGNADLVALEDQITGFGGSGTDTIELSSQLGLAGGDAQTAVLQKGNFASVAALEDAIGDGTDWFDTGLVDRAVAFADTGGNGYVMVDADADGDFTQGVDMIIQLVGVTAFTVADVEFG